MTLNITLIKGTDCNVLHSRHERFSAATLAGGE